MKFAAAIIAVATMSVTGLAQNTIVGADVSFARQLEQRGTVFTDQGTATPVLQILKNHGYTWVRLRIMNDPDTLPNNLAYTLASARDAKALGFHLLLDFHYSDDWADPAHERTPKAWKSLPHAALRQAVLAYTRDTMAAFRNADLMPDMVQIGNEVTSGMLWPDGHLPDHWERFADLVTAGIQGVDAASAGTARPRIMIHIDQGGNSETTQWFFDNLNKLLAESKARYDVIGQSYYPWWQGSLDQLGRNLRFMARTYHKDTMVVETAYDWKPGETFAGRNKPFPETPEGQRDFLRALGKVVRDPANHCLGLFWWEPAAEGAIAKRSFFDDQHKALPVVTAFDIP